jgi:hypothetical protein
MWYPLFNEGSTDVHNEAQSGHPSVITEGLKGTVDAHVHENRCYIESLRLGFNLNTFQFSEYLFVESTCTIIIKLSMVTYSAYFLHTQPMSKVECHN